MTLAVGQLTLVGATKEQEVALTPMFNKVQEIVGTRINPVTVKVRPRSEMPRYRAPRPGDGPTDGRAKGYWRSGNRTILLADDLFPPGRMLDETLGHEVVHVMFDDWLKPAQKKTLLRYLQPEPENYSDTMIGDQDKGYPALPEECIAVWGSAAIFAFPHPAYGALYKRIIVEPLWAEVRAIMLASPPPAPPPVTPDPCAELAAQLTACNAKGAADAVTIRDLESRIAKAKEALGAG